jgi:hypothetical protein
LLFQVSSNHIIKPIQGFNLFICHGGVAGLKDLHTGGTVGQMLTQTHAAMMEFATSWTCVTSCKESDKATITMDSLGMSGQSFLRRKPSVTLLALPAQGLKRRLWRGQAGVRIEPPIKGFLPNSMFGSGLMIPAAVLQG